MSTDYYTRLEQRRGPQPSFHMLSSLAQALRLDSDEQDYLFRVAGHSAPDHEAYTDDIAPGLLRVFERLGDTPALILSPLTEILVQNELSHAMFGDVSELSGVERSAIYRWFAYPETERHRYPEADHEQQGRALVAQLRVALGAMGQGSLAGGMVRELSRISAEFLIFWESQEVSRRFQDHKVFLHPELGRLELDCHALFSQNESQALLVLSAAPGTEAAQKIARLAELSARSSGDQR